MSEYRDAQSPLQARFPYRCPYITPHFVPKRPFSAIWRGRSRLVQQDVLRQHPVRGGFWSAIVLFA